MKIEGLIAAPHTPCKLDHSLNPEAVADQAAHFAKTGVAGVFVGGTTGECHSFSTAERIELMQAWGEAAPRNGLLNVAHVGHNNLPDAQALAEIAEATGADAIGAMAPTFFKPSTVDQLTEWFASLAQAAPELPFYFYDIPSMTGVSLDTEEFLKRGRERIPSLAGVKFTNPDKDLLSQCLEVEGGAFDILFGNDEKLLEGLDVGCRGAVGSSYNFAAPIYTRIISLREQGKQEEARLWQSRSAQMIELLYEYGYLPAAKTVMGMIGIDCGPARQPLANIGSGEVSMLQKQLHEMGFFHWIEQ